MAFLELGKLPLGFGRLALSLELANILEPFFRRALLGFGDRGAARRRADDARALERQCRFTKSVRVSDQGSRRRPRDLPWSLRCALSIRRERLLVRACALARERSRSRGSRPCFLLAQSFRRARDLRCEPALPRSEAFIPGGALARARLLSIAPRCSLRDGPGRRRCGARQLRARRFRRCVG